MTWMLFIWVTTALLALSRGGNAANEGIKLSASGYHLCIHNETKSVPYLALHTVPYTVTKPCGGWLLLMTCPVTLYKVIRRTEYKNVTKQTTRCCDGYVQVGRYCALPLNRSGDFTAKPGSCPTAHGLHPMIEDCEWDIDCPGWQKCCQKSDRHLCSDPASSAGYSENGGYRFNATVTVKTDYEDLMSRARGHLNHTRLLQAMVTGALESDVSVYYLASWPVYPYRIATSLLIDSKSPLSLDTVTPKLHLLLKHVREVSAVTVEDVDECAQSVLRRCSVQANCSNTVGSYQCACQPRYIDLYPSNPGADCTADVSGSNTIELLSTRPPTNTNHTPASNSSQNPQGISTMGPFTSTETSMTTALSHTSPVPFNSSSPAPSTSMSPTVESPLTRATCSPPSITSLWSANVTGTSFFVHWSSRFQTNQTYQGFVSKGSADIHDWETNQTKMEVTGLQPGVLYDVTVTPIACESQGTSVHVSVRTDAQTLDATARLTNIQFTADLQNTSSQAFKNLTNSITEEIYHSLSPEMKAMVDSDQVRIEIRGFYPGSVVVNFTVVFTPSQSQDISNVSTALLNSLMNSTKYTVDENNTNIDDFNECASGEDDCSQWAACKNTWASFTCVCLDGFMDINPERPGRACVVPTVETTTPAATRLSTVSTAPLNQITTATNDPALVTTTRSSTVISTAEMVSTTVPSNSTASDTSSGAQTAVPVVSTIYITTSTTPISATTTAAPATTSTAPTTTSTAPTTTSTAPTTTSTAPTTTSTAPTTTSTAPTTTSTAPTTTSTAPTTTSTAPTTTSTAPTTTSTAPTTSSTAPTTTSTAPTTTSTAPTTISTVPTTTTNPTTTTTTNPISITTIPVTTTPTIPITMAALTNTSTVPTTTSTVPSSTTARTTTAASTIIITAPTTISPVPTTTPNPTTTTATPIPTTAPTTTSTVQTTTTNPTTTTTTPTTTTTTPTTTTTNPKTDTTTPATNTTALSTATNASILGVISAQCNVAAITVTVARDFLLSAKIRESALYLGMQECGVNGGNATHAQLTVAWNECATSLVHNDTHYMASVTLFNTMDQYMSVTGASEAPRIRLEVPIVCGYMKSILLSADSSFMGHDLIKDVIMASGRFQVTVQLMNGTVPLPYNYSLSPEEAVVVDVSLNTSSEHIKVVINRCWATPTQNPVDSHSHIFLENSCSLNTYTKVLTNGNSSTSRVSVQIFSFVKLNVIYLHCHVQICAQIGSETCVPDCLQRTARSSNTVGTASASSGPLRRSGEEPLDEFYTLHVAGISCLGIGLLVILMVGFLLLFYYQRNRVGHYNFNVKPRQENFTYLSFNT